MFPKVSIIVPIYKAEAYLKRCLDSLVNQSLKEIEIVLIDDGSPDCSGVICDEYAKWDTRIKVVHQQNQGVSAARQKGLELATGEFVIHADPDDWVEADMVECLYVQAVNSGSDMVICDYFTESAEGQIYNKQQPSALDHLTVQKEVIFPLIGSCCNKLIKRECFNKYGIKFPKEISFCEDEYVIVCLLNHEIKVSYLDRAFYHYDIMINDNSLVRKKIINDSYRIMREELISLYGSSIWDDKNRAFGVNRKASGWVMDAFSRSGYSSKEFRTYFYKYKNEIWKREYLSLTLRIIYYLSCIGFYKPLQTIAMAFRNKY